MDVWTLFFFSSFKSTRQEPVSFFPTVTHRSFIRSMFLPLHSTSHPPRCIPLSTPPVDYSFPPPPILIQPHVRTSRHPPHKKNFSCPGGLWSVPASVLFLLIVSCFHWSQWKCLSAASNLASGGCSASARTRSRSPCRTTTTVPALFTRRAVGGVAAATAVARMRALEGSEGSNNTVSTSPLPPFANFTS